MAKAKHFSRPLKGTLVVARPISRRYNGGLLPDVPLTRDSEQN